MDNIRLRILDTGDRDDSALPRLLERLPKSCSRKLDDAYRVYDWLHQRKYMIGKCGALNRSKTLRSNLWGSLNRLPMLTRRGAKSADMLMRLLAIALEAARSACEPIGNSRAVSVSVAHSKADGAKRRRWQRASDTTLDKTRTYFRNKADLAASIPALMD